MMATTATTNGIQCAIENATCRIVEPLDEIESGVGFPGCSSSTAVESVWGVKGQAHGNCATRSSVLVETDDLAPSNGTYDSLVTPRRDHDVIVGARARLGECTSTLLCDEDEGASSASTG